MSFSNNKNEAALSLNSIVIESGGKISTLMKTDFEALYQTSVKFVENGEYSRGYELMLGITDTNDFTKKEISDAWLWMGAIVAAFAPHLSPVDESGLHEYAQAIRFNPHNVSALLNIVSCYQSSDYITPYQKQNPELYISAYEALRDQLFDQLSSEEQKKLEVGYDRYLKLKSNSQQS